MQGEEEMGARRAVLIVEDDWLIAQDLSEEVEEAGYDVLGPAHTVPQALALLQDGNPDGAILDVNLRGETSYQIAKVLAERRIPFVFLTGYASDQLRSGFRDALLLNKPVLVPELRTTLRQIMA